MKPTMDAGGKEDRSVDLGRGAEDRGEFSPQTRRSRNFGGTVERRAFGKMPENVFHHNDAGINDQPEIDRPH
jgi:hypothetical protein